MIEKIKKTWGSKKFWIMAVGLMVGMLLLQIWMGKNKLAKDLETIARTATKSMPVMVDSLMRMDSLSVVRPDALQYHYTFVKNDKAEIDTGILRKDYRQSMIDWLKSQPKLDYFHENNITIEMKYMDQQRQLITIVSIDPKEYAVKR